MPVTLSSWLAVGAEVERELDDVSGIWAVGRITAIHAGRSEVDLSYEDGLVEADVPKAELRPRADPCEALAWELAASPLPLQSGDSTPLGVVPQGTDDKLANAPCSGKHVAAVCEKGAEPPPGIWSAIQGLRSDILSLTHTVDNLKQQSATQFSRIDAVIQEILDAKKAVEGWLCQRTDEGITIHQAHPHVDGRPMYGHVLWYSGEALAKYLMWRQSSYAPSDSFAGKSVLELGAGTGVVGLTLGFLGASVTMTDSEPEVVRLLKRNITANALEATADAVVLSFGDASTYVAPRTFDMIVAADVLYEAAQGAVLADALEAHVPIGSGTQVLLAYEHRPEAPLDFFAKALDLDFTVERLQDPQGSAAAAAKGRSGREYDNCRFVELPKTRAREAIEHACFSQSNQRRIQIFRLRRPRIPVASE